MKNGKSPIRWVIALPFWLVGWAGFGLLCSGAWLFACLIYAAEYYRDWRPKIHGRHE